MVPSRPAGRAGILGARLELDVATSNVEVEGAAGVVDEEAVALPAVVSHGFGRGGREVIVLNKSYASGSRDQAISAALDSVLVLCCC